MESETMRTAAAEDIFSKKVKDSGISILFETIKPETASEYLSVVVENQRSLSETHVNMIAEDLISGMWEINSETIKFNEAGRLIDGQHRLAACARSGVPLPTFVARNVPASSMLTLDRHRRRSPGDMLRISGVTNSHKVAATVRKLMMFAMNDFSKKYSAGLIKAVADANPAIHDSVLHCNGDGMVPVSSLAFVHFIGTHYHNRGAEADAFFEVMKTGVPVYNISQDAAFQLREKAIKHRTRSSRWRDDERDKTVYLAWICFCDQKALRVPADGRFRRAEGPSMNVLLGKIPFPDPEAFIKDEPET
jgi:hypothetical protein